VPTYSGAITAALLLALMLTLLYTLDDLESRSIEKIEQRRDNNKSPYYRYDVRPGLTYVEAGKDVTDRPDLEWDRAVSITAMEDLTARGIDTIFMYTLLTRPGDVDPHPAGPKVFGDVRQWKLANSVSGDDVILTRIIKRPETRYKGPF
jgi:hypothetical protein